MHTLPHLKHKFGRAHTANWPGVTLCANAFGVISTNTRIQFANVQRVLFEVCAFWIGSPEPRGDVWYPSTDSFADQPLGRAPLAIFFRRFKEQGVAYAVPGTFANGAVNIFKKLLANPAAL